jgi:hypothetical protein
MSLNDFLAREIVGHGAYLCLRRRNDADPGGVGARVAALVERLGLTNEFEAGGTPSRGSVAFLRRRGATPADIGDEDVLRAECVLHVASTQAEIVDEFCGEASRLLSPLADVHVLRGVVRPKNYTGAAMNNFAYARQITQQPGTAMPNAFLIPLSKTAEWWRKDWMERHTYFLPRYDDEGRMISEGHALATEAGISCLLRRTYRNAIEPAPDGQYDFVTYFECSDAAVPIFHQVCAALRDVKRNPEWRFVREGPTWQGRRVAAWEDLFTPAGVGATS